MKILEFLKVFCWSWKKCVDQLVCAKEFLDITEAACVIAISNESAGRVGYSNYTRHESDLTSISATYDLFVSVILQNVHRVNARNSYMFLAPATVRPGRVFTVEGSLLEVPDRPVTVTASLRDSNREITSNEVVVTGKESVSLDLQVPTDLAPSKDYRVNIAGFGGLTFKSEKTVQYEGKSISVFIQTDKSVYKPGQKVRFRVFGVTPELKVVFDKVKIELHDPKGNKVKQWAVSEAEMRDVGGVLVRQQQLSEYPILGTWTLKARLLSYGEKFEEQKFTVDEYVLPKFEVELDLPTFGRIADTAFEGKVTAKYTFGKPVKGEVSMRIKPQKPSRSATAKEIEMQFPIEGTASFTIPKSKLESIEPNMDQKTLIFEANVTESLTKARQSDNQGVTFYSVPYKVVFPKSLPNTFKPGMPYTAVAKVAMRDDMPPDQVTSQLKVTVTEITRRRRFEPRRSRTRWWRPSPPRDVRSSKPSTFHNIPADGVVEIPIKVDTKPIKIEVKAEYEKASSTLTLKKRHSPSSSYLQITQTSKTAKAGEKSAFKIQKTATTLPVIKYQIYSKGRVVETGDIPKTKFSKWRLRMTSAMAPKSRIVVFYVTKGGEVVADAISVNVEGVFENKVTVNFNNTEAQPSDGISLNITADPGSRVNVLGVDKSVLIMGTGNDVTQGEVIQELQSFDTKSPKDRDDFPICDWFCWRWPVSVGGEDVKDVFQDSGLLVFTDALVYEHRERLSRPPWDRWGPLSLPRFEFFGGFGGNRRAMPRRRMMRPMAMGAGGFMSEPSIMAESTSRFMSSPKIDRIAKMDSVSPPSQKDLAPVTRTRRLFPETWLWIDATVPSAGVTTVTETVPDTITSWLATAFAVHPTTGLGITENSANLRVSMPFFMTLTLPYSVVRGEKVVVQANIHNYSPKDLFVRVELSKSLEFDNIQITDLSQTTTSADVTRTLTVASDSVGSVYFPIIPRKLGRVDIKIKAQTTLAADAITKQLLVEPEGTEREYNLPVVIDLKDSGSLSKKVTVEFPKSTVAGSQRVKATAIGDIMGPSISGLDKLLKMPYGCGEQNMLKFAPNIFIMKYLDSTGKIDEEIKQKATEYMESGYQRELNYAHPDGSYSAFGDRDPSGSTWLTAFVLKSFIQATPYIYVDENVIEKAVTWLIKQQNEDGTFNEPGRVIHKGMQGGSTAGKVSLTAYVLISLLEANTVNTVKTQVSGARDKALVYLEREAGGLTDVYDIAIVAYVLTLANSTQADTVWQKLNLKAIEQGGRKHWEKKASTATTTIKPWTKRTGSAIDIELTAYALLGLALKQDRLEGPKVLKWLTENRNQDGGFVSTQDTVIALQSLAEMASQITSAVYDLRVDISGSGWTETSNINNINAAILQSREVPNDAGEVTITATGIGFALAQLEVVYNIDDDSQKESFQLTTELPRESMNSFDMKACARWLEEGSSSMALIEVGSPSGFYPDLASLVTEPAHKRVEIEARKLVLYFDEIGRTDTCVHVTMQRIAMVAGAQPVVVRVMDYYEPGRSVTEFYIPTTLTTSTVCDVCLDCDFCSPQNTFLQ